MVETLHQSDQGLFKHLILEVKKLCSADNIISMDRRLYTLKSKFLFDTEVRLPSFGIWEDTSSVQGHEYRSLMQVFLIMEWKENYQLNVIF